MLKEKIPFLYSDEKHLCQTHWGSQNKYIDLNGILLADIYWLVRSEF